MPIILADCFQTPIKVFSEWIGEKQMFISYEDALYIAAFSIYEIKNAASPIIS